jgi:nicotinamide riboside kinase
MMDLDRATIHQDKHVWVWGPPTAGKSILINQDLRQPNTCVVTLPGKAQLTLEDLIMMKGDNYDRMIISSNQPMEAYMISKELAGAKQHFFQLHVPAIRYESGETPPSHLR